MNCGACWSYSTTAFFESDLIISRNYTNEIDLSEQFLLKCDNRSLKCDGGFLFWAMERVIESGGMPRESQYPYNHNNLWMENGMCYESDIIRLDPNTRMVSYY
jgi:C1A family cysteine protease